MQRNRASKAQLIKRREEIQRLILQGHTSIEIVNMAEKEFRTTKRAIQEDLRLIGKEWAARAPEKMLTMRNKYADRLELLFYEAIGKGHVKVALAVQQEIHKLNGVYIQKDADNADNMPQFVNISKRSKLKVVDDK